MRVKKYYKLVRVDYEDSEYMRLKNVSNEVGIFKMVKVGSPTAPNLEYSLDGVTWTTYDFSTLPEVQVAAGANIYFRGTNNYHQFNKGDSAYVKFSFNKTCEGHGNMCSLFNPDPAVFSTITSIGTYGLTYVFNGCTTLTTAPDLSNVTSIENNGLYQTFNGCTSLTTPPDLSNLTSIWQNGLGSAFVGCTSLTTPPDLSNLTSGLGNALRATFYNCTSLTTAPDLSNLTSIGDYGLATAFYNCTSLTTAPNLSNLTSVGSTRSLEEMFRGCSLLSDVTAPNIQDLNSNILRNWLNQTGTSVPAGTTKVVNVPTGATIETDSISGIPTGWTRVDY